MYSQHTFDCKIDGNSKCLAETRGDNSKSRIKIHGLKSQCLLFFPLPTFVGNVETLTVVTNNFRVIQLANLPN